MKYSEMTPFLEALRSPGHFALFEAIRYKRHRQALLLTEAGVDVNCRNGRGLTPLIYTVTMLDDDRSRAKFTRLLLEAGSDPNLTDWDGFTALMHAARMGQAEVIKPLLENKWTNINLKDPEGNTALILAAIHGQAYVISVFISHYKQDLASLNLNKKNNQGFTALQLAISNGHDECARLLTRDAQFFPSTIAEFPDPKVLDRDPTPTEHRMSCPEIQCFTPKTTHRSSSRTSVSRKTMKNVGVYCNNGVNELDSYSSSDEKPVDNNVGLFTATKLRSKTTQTPSSKTRSRTSKPQSRILEPLNGLDSVFIHHLSLQANYKAKDPSELLLPRTKSGYRSNWWSGESNSLQVNQNKRPESEPSLLPMIPSASPLPPVKKSLNSSPSKCSLQSTALFNMDLPATGIDLFKKNVFVNSS